MRHAASYYASRRVTLRVTACDPSRARVSVRRTSARKKKRAPVNKLERVPVSQSEKGWGFAVALIGRSDDVAAG